MAAFWPLWPAKLTDGHRPASMWPQAGLMLASRHVALVFGMQRFVPPPWASYRAGSLRSIPQVQRGLALWLRLPAPYTQLIGRVRVGMLGAPLSQRRLFEGQARLPQAGLALNVLEGMVLLEREFATNTLWLLLKTQRPIKLTKRLRLGPPSHRAGVRPWEVSGGAQTTLWRARWGTAAALSANEALLQLRRRSAAISSLLVARKLNDMRQLSLVQQLILPWGLVGVRGAWALSRGSIGSSSYGAIDAAWFGRGATVLPLYLRAQARIQYRAGGGRQLRTALMLGRAWPALRFSPVMSVTSTTIWPQACSTLRGRGLVQWKGASLAVTVAWQTRSPSRAALTHAWPRQSFFAAIEGLYDF